MRHSGGHDEWPYAFITHLRIQAAHTIYDLAVAASRSGEDSVWPAPGPRGGRQILARMRGNDTRVDPPPSHRKVAPSAHVVDGPVGEVAQALHLHHRPQVHLLLVHEHGGPHRKKEVEHPRVETGAGEEGGGAQCCD